MNEEFAKLFAGVRYGTAVVVIVVFWWVGFVDALAFVLRLEGLSVSALIREWYADRTWICLAAMVLVWHLFVQR